MLDRKPRANPEVRTAQGSSASRAHMLLVHTPGPPVQPRHYSSVDSSPHLHHWGPGNASSPEPGQRTRAYDHHSGGSGLSPFESLGAVGPFERPATSARSPGGAKKT